jgi:hypothetical protein
MKKIILTGFFILALAVDAEEITITKEKFTSIILKNRYEVPISKATRPGLNSTPTLYCYKYEYDYRAIVEELCEYFGMLEIEIEKTEKKKIFIKN